MAIVTNISNDQLKEIYYLLVLTRNLDERGRKLFKQARFTGTYFSAVGQEATTVVPTYGLRKEDVIAPSHREIGANVAKGVPIKLIMAQIYARKTSPDKGKSHPCHYGYAPLRVITPASTVAAQVVVGTGAALAFKIRKVDNVVVSFFGDGATSRGGFHEALNFAGIHKLPIVYICQNNLWAESVPLRLQTALTDLSERAKAYGFPGVTIDGNDVMEVLRTSREAIEKARRGDGSTFIECKTYRWYGHSEIDPANYRAKEELEAWMKKDPIPHYEKYLLENKILDEKEKNKILVKVEKEIDEAVDFAEKSPYPAPEEALEDVYYEGDKT